MIQLGSGKSAALFRKNCDVNSYLCSFLSFAPCSCMYSLCLTTSGCAGTQGYMIWVVAVQRALLRHVDTKPFLKYLSSSMFTALVSELCGTMVNTLLSNMTTSHSYSQKLFSFIECRICELCSWCKAAHGHSGCVQNKLWSNTVCVSCDLWLHEQSMTWVCYILCSC